MTDLGARKKSGRSVRAGGDACSAADAGGSVHCQIGIFLRHRNRVAVGRASGGDGNVTAAGNNAIEGTPIHDQIFHYRKCPGAPWFQIKLVAIFEMAHMKLANRRSALWAVGYSIDHESTHAAYTLAAIVVESNGFFTFGYEFFVEHIEHFQERHVRTHLLMFVAHDAAGMTCRFLPPDVESQSHIRRALLIAALRGMNVFEVQRLSTQNRLLARSCVFPGRHI